MNRHKQHVHGLIALIVTVAVIVAGILIWQWLEDAQHTDETTDKSISGESASRTASEESPAGAAFDRTGTIVRDGHRYRIDQNLETILLIGYDKNIGEEIKGFSDGGQADFLLLLAVDNSTQTVNMLQIDRDIMTRVNTVGFTGRPAGGKVMQICLAHAYGDNVVKNDSNTRQAVQNLLHGIPIDYTVSMGMDGVKEFNKLVGGVTVTLEESVPELGEEFVAGASVRLTDKQAYDFCHVREGVGDGRNVSRMGRQKLYIESAAHLVQSRTSSESGFAKKLVEGIRDISNMMDDLNEPVSAGWFINQLNNATRFSVSQPYILGGERITNPVTDFVECTPDPEEILDWVINNLCYEV